MKNNKCIECGNIIYKTSLRCNSCNNKGIRNINYIDGRASKENFCIDCNNKISVNGERCRSCSTKVQLKNPKNHPNYKDGRTFQKYYCKEKNCLNEISYRNWLIGNRRCNGCANKGKLNHNYIDGRSFLKYPQDFGSQLKNNIKNRDNFECKNCGMTQEEHFIVYGRDIEVHHIDYNRNNCDEKNLITLCKQCNLRANKNRDYWEEFYNNKLIIK